MMESEDATLKEADAAGKTATEQWVRRGSLLTKAGGKEELAGTACASDWLSQPAVVPVSQASWLLSAETHLSGDFAEDWRAEDLASPSSTQHRQRGPPRLRLNTGSHLVPPTFEPGEAGEDRRGKGAKRAEDAQGDKPRNNSLRSCGQSYPALTLSKKNSQASFCPPAVAETAAVDQPNRFLQKEPGEKTPLKKLGLRYWREKSLSHAGSNDSRSATPLPVAEGGCVSQAEFEALVTPVVKDRMVINAPPARFFDFNSQSRQKLLPGSFAEEESAAKRRQVLALGHKRSKTETELNLPKIAVAEPPLNADEGSLQLSERPTRFERDYKVLSVLGTGSHGKVFHVLGNFDQLHYAVKQVRTGLGQPLGARNEALALAGINTKYESQHFVKYYCSWAEEDSVFICMELCSSSLLALKRRRVPGQFCEEFLRRVIRHVCKALKKIHGDMIVHFDVKTENILVSPSQKFKLADLGLARNLHMREDMLSIEEGDCRYMAKELLDGGILLTAGRDYTKCDIFSLGISVYELMVGDRLELPRHGQLWQDLRAGPLPLLETLPGYSSSFKRLVASMMDPNPAARPSAKAILSQHLLYFDKSYERFLKLRIHHLEQEELKRNCASRKEYREY